MRKKNGFFCDKSVIKTMWNVTEKFVQKKYCENFGVAIYLFIDAIFKYARSARNDEYN